MVPNTILLTWFGPPLACGKARPPLAMATCAQHHYEAERTASWYAWFWNGGEEKGPRQALGIVTVPDNLPQIVDTVSLK